MRSEPRADHPGVVNALTVDVEDYFQVEAFAGAIDRDDWESLPRRVDGNVERLLDLFAERGVRATFFTLGWVAERHPALVRRIVADGHELASHGYGHRRIVDMTPEAFREDIRRAKQLLEDIGGVPVAGYRAPSFSIVAESLWAHAVLAEEGYRYSSSVNPVRHDLYGMPDAPPHPYQPIDDDAFLEVPMTAIRLLGRRIPSGGGFFRLLPYAFFGAAWRGLNRAGQPAVFYFHPWEIDPRQPRQRRAPLKSRLRHYARLGAMEKKVVRALDDFSWDRMDRIFLPVTARSEAA